MVKQGFIDEDAEARRKSKKALLSEDSHKFGKPKPKPPIVLAFGKLITMLDTYTRQKSIRILNATSLFLKGLVVECVPDALGKRLLPAPRELSFQERRDKEDGWKIAEMRNNR